MSIQACLFDMGNVLVHFSHQKMCQNIATVCGVEVSGIHELLIGSGLQWQLERGEISEEQFHADLEQRLQKSLCIKELKHAAADIFWLNESIVPLLQELRQLGMRLVLLSNTSLTHLQFIQQNFDVLKYFDELTTSFAVGALKPDETIYQDAVNKANCSAQDCFYTDDIEPYVLQARSLGIHAEVYTDTNLTRTALRNLGVPVTQPAVETC